MTARTLLLGHTGFIGSAIRSELERRGLPWNGKSSKDLDLTKPDSASALPALWDEATTVFLLSRVSRSKPPQEQFDGDKAVAANAAQALAGRKAGLFVFFGTTAVYGPSAAGPLSERTPETPDSPYAIAKLDGERLLADAARRSGTPFLILRPSMVYGPGDTSSAYGPARLIRSAVERGEVRLFGDGLERRDYLYVDDLARAAVDLSLKRASGVYLLGSGTPATFVEIVSVLERLRGGPLSVVNEPRRMPKFDQLLSLDKLRAALPEFKPRDLASGLEAAYRCAAETA